MSLKRGVVIVNHHLPFLRLLFFFVSWLFAGVAFAAGGEGTKNWPWVKQDVSSDSRPAVTVQYLGTGGVLVDVNGDAILADPFFSNPSITDLLLLKNLKPKDDVIKRYLPDTKNVKGLFVGHGHYDHLMDVPVVAGMVPVAAKVYGSDTAIYQISSSIENSRLVKLTTLAITHQDKRESEWISLSEKLRVVPVLSGHAPHVGGVLFAGGRVKNSLPALPEDVLDWQCGQTLAYLFEWLSDGNVVFRALYVSSAAEFPLGVPPKGYLENLVSLNESVDLVLLGVANFQAVENYPQGLIAQIKPKAVVMLHWERFWQPYIPGKEQARSESEVESFIAAVESSLPSAKLFLPKRLDKIFFNIEVLSE